MSRSYKKVSATSQNAGSMKEWKRSANKALRVRVRVKLSGVKDWDEFVCPEIREASNIYDSPRDGYCISFKEPTEYECYEDWLRFSSLIRTRYQLGANGHFKDCDCSLNPNNWYRKAFRK